jgi:hypothetical protein
VSREGHGEALIGGRRGQPLSRESLLSWVPTQCKLWNATRLGALSRAFGRPGVVRDPGMCRRVLRGNREISGSTVWQQPPVRIGKASARHSRAYSRASSAGRGSEWRGSDGHLQKRPALVEGALRRGPNPGQRSDRWPGLKAMVLLRYMTRHSPNAAGVSVPQYRVFEQAGSSNWAGAQPKGSFRMGGSTPVTI